MTIPTKILHSTTPGNKPSALVTGQIAINEADRALYYLDPTTTTPSSLLDQVGSLSAANSLIINGAMEVDQINFGTAVTGVTSVTQYAIDMVKISTTGSQVISTQQVVDAPPGFFNSIKFTVTGANASPGSSDICAFQFPIEGYRAKRLGLGTANASNISIGFWAKAFRAGIYGLNVSNSANNRGYSVAFTLATTGVWQWVTATIPGDLSGTWLATTGKGLIVSIVMMAGSGLLMTPNTWTAGGMQGVSGQTNGVQSTSDLMQITGLCLFSGYVMPLSTRAQALVLPFQESLQACSRYYQKSYDYTTALAAITLLGASNTQLFTNPLTDATFLYFPNGSMATDPAISTWSPSSGAIGKAHDYTGAADVNSVISNIGMKGFLNVITANAASPFSVAYHWAADARL